jgi:TPR repeat protein
MGEKRDIFFAALMSSNGLRQLVKSVERLTVICYEESSPDFALNDFELYLSLQDIDKSVVKQVILLGYKAETRLSLFDDIDLGLYRVFPDAHFVKFRQSWKTINPEDIYVDSPLIVHLAPNMGSAFNDFFNGTESAAHLRDIIEQTQLLYAALAIGDGDENQRIVTFTQVDTFRFKPVETAAVERTLYCKEKAAYIEQCKKTLSEHRIFLQCIETARHGCDTCRMVKSYGKAKLCPMAQHEIALIYRKNENSQAHSLSHQLDRLAARQGFARSEIQVADNLAAGFGCDKNVKEAISIYRKHAIRGNVECSNKIIELAHTDDSIENIVALPWIVRMANGGDLEKAKMLVAAYTQGTYGLPTDDLNVEKWQNIIAESGDVSVISSLLQVCMDSNDWKNAIKWCKKLRDLNCEAFDASSLEELNRNYIHSLATTPSELYSLGLRFLRGDAIERDIALAETCLLESAENGYISAQEKLCEEYYSGEIFAKDFSKSAHWGDCALEQGSKSIRFRVAWLYDDQKGVTPNYSKSRKLYRELIQEGNSAAMNNLGWMYDCGHFYKENHKKAFEWYLKAAEAGNSVAMRNVGNCYRNATGVEADYKLAFDWLVKSAKCGDKYAMNQVATMYRVGQGVDKDEKLMTFWYKKAIDAGDEDSIISLGNYYEAEKDYEKALTYYKKAAEHGSEVGQYNMGFMYEKGMGVPASERDAIYWYRESARQGYVDAQTKLMELGANWLEKEKK